MKPIRILIAGEGGQGIQTVAKVIAIAAADSGYNVSYIPSFGVEQRGTPSVSFVTISRDKIFYPRFSRADYAVLLQRRAVSKISGYLTLNTKVIFDSSTIDKSDLPRIAHKIMALPATAYATKKFVAKTFNVIVIGKLSALFGLKEDTVWKAIENVLGKKFTDEKIRKANKDAYLFGRTVILEINDFSLVSHSPAKEKILVKGYGKKGEIDPKLCKGCGICIEKCPTRALKFGETLGVFATPVPDADLEKCIACGNCRQFCPEGAIYIMADRKTSVNKD